jgi:hypothetical protein
MKTSLRILLFSLILLAGGCVLGSVQHLPPLKIACTVIDAESKSPIPGAKITIIYTALYGHIEFGPFTTDSKGQVLASAPSKTVYLTGGEAYGGGYTRILQVETVGQKTWSLYLNTLKEKNISEYTFQIPKAEPPK